ncbi:MAG TPA: hypothetical protein VFC13_13475 [Actinomycetes bacterium]|jgi:hypothetical protein|nr:hypothetical protein [Actinomycetes bacterium]
MAARTGTYVVAIGIALAGLVLVGCANAPALHRTPASEESLARPGRRCQGHRGA